MDANFVTNAPITICPYNSNGYMDFGKTALCQILQLHVKMGTLCKKGHIVPSTLDKQYDQDLLKLD